MSSYAHVVQTTAKQIISRRRKNENVFKMSKVEKCTCKACKNTVFHCQKIKNARAKRAKILFCVVKYANLWSFCYRRRHGCLSSLLPDDEIYLENYRPGWTIRKRKGNSQHVNWITLEESKQRDTKITCLASTPHLCIQRVFSV